jgi:hypothetical protein
MRLLGLVLLVNSLLAIVVVKLVPFFAPNDEYLYDGLQFAAHHRIYETFLPVGFSGLLGVAAWSGGHKGVVVLSVGLSLLVIVSAWFYLRFLGVSVRATFVLTALLSVYPDLLLSLHKVQETELTAVLVYGFVLFLMKAIEEDHFGGVDTALALTLGYAITVRANLLLFVFVGWYVFWRLGVPRAGMRLLVQLLIVLACFVGISTSIHGVPFLPKYGPYNFYSGFNEETQNYPNEEDSLFPVLPAHGIQPPNGDARFTTANLRDASLNPVYMRLGLEFLREHPVKSVGLVLFKCWNLLRPNLSFHSPRSAAGIVKILSALGVPLWIAAMVLLPHPGPPKVKLILALTMLCYAVPFLLTVSAPRFREPLDLFCWMDLGAILWAWRRQSMEARRSDGMSPVLVASQPD